MTRYTVRTRRPIRGDRWIAGSVGGLTDKKEEAGRFELERAEELARACRLIWPRDSVLVELNEEQTKFL